jgi:hypothetical protein
MVIKMIMDRKAHDSEYFSDAITQIVSQLYACKFNDMSGFSRRVSFNPVSIMQLKERGGQLVVAEPRMDGKYVKHSDNNGYVNSCDELAPAFSHFTYEHSGCKLLVCDIQGVADKYTDPQIHTQDGEGYGNGNLGRKGIVEFFRSHRCNGMCAALKLPQRKYQDRDLFTSKTRAATTPVVPWNVQSQCMAAVLTEMKKLSSPSLPKAAPPPAASKLRTRESPTRRESPSRRESTTRVLSSSATVKKDQGLGRTKFAMSFDCDDDLLGLPDASYGVYNIEKQKSA